MKKILFLAMLLCAYSSMSAQETATKTKVAIYTTGEVENGYKKVIGSKVTSVITQSSEYVAVERTVDFLNALSQEQDYQTSGAVSDNQIMKIGQQFGVHYVVVLDISNLFGSLFISARMIDVQTGLIKESAELGQEVNSMDGLIRISTLIARAIVGTEMYKCEGPFAREKDLFDFVKSKVPQGYKIATSSEIATLIEIHDMKGTIVNYPIYCDLSTYIDDRYNYTKGTLKFKGDSTAVYDNYWYYDTKSVYEEYWDDDSEKWRKRYVGSETDYSSISSNYSITSGYVYLLKE